MITFYLKHILPSSVMLGCHNFVLHTTHGGYQVEHMIVNWMILHKGSTRKLFSQRNLNASTDDIGMGDIDILLYNYCEAKLMIIALTISILKIVYK